jgi:hypothetical protein
MLGWTGRQREPRLPYGLMNAVHIKAAGFNTPAPRSRENARDHLWSGFPPAFVARSFLLATAKEWAMQQNGSKTIMNARSPRPARPFAARSRRWTSNAARPEQKNSQNAQRNYERYFALARAEGQSGNTIGAENYYQYAEHYFRSMSADSEGT